MAWEASFVAMSTGSLGQTGQASLRMSGGHRPKQGQPSIVLRQLIPRVGPLSEHSLNPQPHEFAEADSSCGLVVYRRPQNSVWRSAAAVWTLPDSQRRPGRRAACLRVDLSALAVLHYPCWGCRPGKLALLACSFACYARHTWRMAQAGRSRTGSQPWGTRRCWFIWAVSPLQRPPLRHAHGAPLAMGLPWLWRC